MIVAHCEVCPVWCSNTMRTARSRTSGAPKPITPELNFRILPSSIDGDCNGLRSVFIPRLGLKVLPFSPATTFLLGGLFARLASSRLGANRCLALTHWLSPVFHDQSYRRWHVTYRELSGSNSFGLYLVMAIRFLFSRRRAKASSRLLAVRGMRSSKQMPEQAYREP